MRKQANTNDTFEKDLFCLYFLLKIYICLVYICFSVLFWKLCLFICFLCGGLTYHSIHVEVRGEPLGVSFLLLLCGFWGCDSSSALVAAEPSFWPGTLGFIKTDYSVQMACVWVHVCARMEVTPLCWNYELCTTTFRFSFYREFWDWYLVPNAYKVHSLSLPCSLSGFLI